MFERPMKEGPATVLGGFAALLTLWVFYGLSWLVPEAKAPNMFDVLFMVTAAGTAAAAGYFTHVWARAFPKWKLVRDRMERSM